MIDEKLLTSEEKAVFALRSLYRKYGYLPYKMSKFEEYELYIRNKDFLTSEHVITFNDTNGKLMALKPDVTLSIIKNGEDIPGFKQKVYYDENVYRVSDSTHRFKEIKQEGLECIGDIDLYDVYEVIRLAAESLSVISGSYVLEISHLGVLQAVLDSIAADAEFREKALYFIAEKNAHDLRRLCTDLSVDSSAADRLCSFIGAYGKPEKVLRELREQISCQALDELEKLTDMLSETDFSDKIILDFSVVNSMSYYNRFVFRGFLDGVSGSVLAGGQYDKMMERMKRRSGALGFAVYLDLLEQLRDDRESADVDVLLLYDDATDPAEVSRKVREIVRSRRTVSAQKTVPDKMRYRSIQDIRKGDALC